MKISTKRLREAISDLEVLVQDNRIALPKEMEKEDLDYFWGLLNEAVAAVEYFDTELNLHIEGRDEDGRA
jgi:hypothetical protein